MGLPVFFAILECFCQAAHKNRRVVNLIYDTLGYRKEVETVWMREKQMILEHYIPRLTDKAVEKKEIEAGSELVQVFQRYMGKKEKADA